MNTMNGLATLLAMIAAVALGACTGAKATKATPYPPNDNVASAGDVYSGYGVVDSIELEKREQQNADAHRITVRMKDGAYQSLIKNSDAGFRVGDRVLFENGDLRRY